LKTIEKKKRNVKNSYKFGTSQNSNLAKSQEEIVDAFLENEFSIDFNKVISKHSKDFMKFFNMFSKYMQKLVSASSINSAD